MQYVYGINSSFSITSLSDLSTLRTILEACNLKPNYCHIARELGKDRRTVQKYYLNGVPETKRNKASAIDAYYDMI